MKKLNCIIVYDRNREKLLFCRRMNDPYKGLYNLVGGKAEPGEDGFSAAYRELYEETGIGREEIELRHMMDFTYYNQGCVVEVYAGALKQDVTLIEEKHPLVWFGPEEDFFSMEKFAGEGNIGHMLKQTEIFGEGITEPEEAERRRRGLI